MPNWTLGLDLGTNSIGWALLESDEQQEPQKLLDCGARIFQEAVEAKTRTPKNRARREARTVRRLHARRKMRRQALLSILETHEMLPVQAGEINSNFSAGDPYELRRRGLDERLEPSQFGQVLLQLCQRRGFLSNRKTQRGKDKEEGKVKEAIGELRRQMQDSGARTLGEYLATQSKKRCRHTHRDMYEQEFEELWKIQSTHYPELLTSDLKVQIYRAIFFQRPLKVQKFLVGKCTFEKSRKRAARVWLEAQRFRIWQDINNLEVRNPETREYRRLAAPQRQQLFGKLEQQETLTWKSARKLLGIPGDHTFNLEDGGKKKLIGNLTAARLRKAVPKTEARPNGWDSYSPDEQQQWITDLHTIQDPKALLKRLQKHWKLDEPQAEKVAEVESSAGYAMLSLKAINKLLPFLEQGMVYERACQAAAYLREDQKARTVTDKLPLPPYLRNPVVQKALYEARRVVNAIIREHGKPALIRVELARDMKLTKKQKERADKQNRKNQDLNKLADDECQNLGIPSSGGNRLKYRLWRELGNELCPYTGRRIGLSMLFSEDVDVDHIVPRSRSLDDSYMNKTVCLATENRQVKGNQTPWEAYGETERYESILQRVEHSRMPYAKRRKFEQKEIDTDAFVNRQLSDTRYISVEVKDYLKQLGTEVEISKGEATAALRRWWGLNGILATNRSDVKNRADHRHHAIDAVVIGLTSRAVFQKLSRLSAVSETSLTERRIKLPPPWFGFRSDVDERIESVIVSHAATRKITGALHEETAYGISEMGKGDPCYVYRKPLNAITANETEKIRDPQIKQLARQRWDQFGGNLKKAFGDRGNPLLHSDGKTPIHRVRLEVNFSEKTPYLSVKDAAGKEYKHYKLGSYHHVEIIENIDTGDRKGRFVSTLEAARRARIEKVPIVDRACEEGWQFVMWLCPNDLLEIEENGRKEYYRVQKMSGAIGVIQLRQHNVVITKVKDATGKVILDTEPIGRLIRNPNTLRGGKVTVDPIGKVSYCHD